MEKIFESLPAILTALKGNSYGVMALAILVVAMVVVLFFREAPLIARFTAALLVVLSCTGVSFAVYDGLRAKDPLLGKNGSPCIVDGECEEGYCWPGPHPKIGGSDKKYCVARDLHCALPGFAGAKKGNSIYLGATKLTCKDPSDTLRAQFYAN